MNEMVSHCHMCGQPLVERVPYPEACPACERIYPPSLVKACADSFDYALRLRNGDVFHFGEAKVYGEFVHLDSIKELVDGHSMDRGIDVRLSEIMWCADAPDGS